MAYTTIKKPSDYFNTKLWTGTGANLSITGVGFQPDFTWIKNRANTDDHNLFDVLRGFSTDALLRSNTTGAATDTTEGIKSFDSDGFSLGTNGSSNGNGQGMVSWNWKANGAGSANTDGTINSTVSASATSGFSIVKWTGNGSAGATVGHGLGAVPKMIIMKNLTESSRHWQIYHESIGNTHYLQFDTNAKLDDAGSFNDTSPTSSVFTLGSSNRGNENTKSFIAYCFAEKKGYSKFGSFTGNASADGTFVYTGFKPAFLTIKRATGGTGNWHLFDSKRLGYNVNNYGVQPNLNSAENTANDLDLLSNGFKNRQSGNDLNGSNTYIYMAFAEQPLIGDNPATAR